MAGPEKNMAKGWELLGEFIDMDPAEVLIRYFGCMHHEESQIKLPATAHPFHEVFEKALKLQLLLSGMKTIGILILRTCWLSSISVTLVSVYMFPPRTMFPGFPP